jgi:hypothetical protein
MIGFRFDGVKRTMRLPAEKAKTYVKDVHTVLRRTIVPLKTLQVLIGKLRHASVILPAAKGFFTPLNFAIRGNPATIDLGVILESAPKIMHAPLGTLCDNTPTVSWVEKMASKAATPTAGRMLRGLAFMLHCHHAGPLIMVHVPETDNVMADIASRPTKAQKLFHCPTALTDSAFCSAFDAAFPLPDDQQWTLASSPPWVRSNVFETLRGMRLALPRWTGPNGPSIGQPGRRIAPCTVPILIHGPQHLTPTSSSRLLLP